MRLFRMFKPKRKTFIPFGLDEKIVLNGKSGIGYSNKHYFLWNGEIRRRRTIAEGVREYLEGKSYNDIYPLVDYEA